MTLYIERAPIDPEDPRHQFYVSFKPALTREEADVRVRVPIEVAVSVSENGELADLSFELPRKYRSEQALSFIRKHETANIVDPRVFVTVPGFSGDSVFTTAANLELDAAGRIIGMDIH